MPYSNERATASGGFDILNDPDVKLFIESVQTVRDHGDRINFIRDHLIDVTDRVHDIDGGVIMASDASPYESVVKKDFPSIRVGVIKFSEVLILVNDYKKLRDRNTPFVDPVAVAQLKKQSSQSKVILPGAGITHADYPKAKSFFRATVFNDIFKADQFKYDNTTLYDTFVELLRRSGKRDNLADGAQPYGDDAVVLGSIVTRDGKEGIEFKNKSPVDGAPLRENLFVPIHPGYVDIGGDPAQRVYVTDSLRVQEVFNEEGGNTECFNRLMSVLEHLRVIHLIHCAFKADLSIVANMNFIVDGPLAIFGEAARFHRSIMSLLHDIRAECRKKGLRGPLVMGISKTGKVVEHAQLIEHLLTKDSDGKPMDGTYILPVTDAYRTTFIEPDKVETGSNFGDETYYGQTFLVRTSRNKVFDVTLAYPFPRKGIRDGVPFKRAKVDLQNYGEDIAHMVSVIEMMQTDLFQNALIPIHLAHRYASIAHSPGGKSLDRFIREILANKEAA
ncbi:hypothetical protein L905_19390 [Agrobacterium sp. TS43]|uniref:hypothetical protein n=1 Tax=Agrobacterium TaxID=357 RepID=UPI00049F8D27|nr:MULTISPECIES: hypothetical protein [Agrobacterium]KDR87651.1 hypothetical protein K538_23575 [Agrobacterium tumefaciens GW4]KVK45410.1 hypothetical protein L904_25905 [Agrobacterium sp. LY4]KVK45485.1 hypothetical protein L903_25920 [Agrobacterium sp. JL28]KVK58994.1 hypothetical protein L906_25835 [Agrobacterium sp. TS45]KVK63185.1 hypothetical protein L907_25450 [Agrobacterium sp. C13]